MEGALAPVVGQKLRELLEFSGERLNVALVQSANSSDEGIVPVLRGGKQDITMVDMRQTYVALEHHSDSANPTSAKGVSTSRASIRDGQIRSRVASGCR